MEPAKTRVIYVVGAPGGGKGTQCAKLTESFGFCHLSIGDIMRAEVKAKTAQGRAVEAIVQAGELVPKELTVDLLMKHLEGLQAHTILLDGFPRSLEQAIYLEQVLQPIDFMLYFETDQEDVLVNRLIERGKTSGRADDNATTIVNRFQVYKSESVPVLQLYGPFNIIRRVNCLGTMSEVLRRTINVLHPEFSFFIGCKLSGKSTASNFLAQKYDYQVLHLADVAKKRVNHRWVTIQDDREVAEAAVDALQRVKSHSLAVLEGFPANQAQARHFSHLLSAPSKVVYFKCAKDTAQNRFFTAGLDCALPEFNKHYESFCSEIQGIAAFYQGNFCEIDTNDKTELTVQLEVELAVQPEIVLLRGEIKGSFIEYLKGRNYTALNAANLLTLWRQGRGLSSNTATDDYELLQLLSKTIYSGTGIKQFVLYNFALNDMNLLDEFEGQVCRIREIHYLHSASTELPDEISMKFFSEDRIKVIDTMNTQGQSVLDELFTEMYELGKTWAVVLLGPALSGKSDIAAALKYPTVNFHAIIEETKTHLSSEQEPKGNLTFSEFLEGVKRHLRTITGKTIVVDGCPPAEILFSTGDPVFPDIPAVAIKNDEESKIPEQEEVSLERRVNETVKRLDALYSLFKRLLTVELEAPLTELFSRYREKNEIGEGETIPTENTVELLESYLTFEKLSKGEKLIKGKIPKVLSFNVTDVPLDSITKSIRSSLDLCLILIIAPIKADSLFSAFFWKNNLFCIDIESLLKASGLSPPYSPALKLSLINSQLKNKPLRDNIIVLNNYIYDDHYNPFNDLIELESLGTIKGLITVNESIEEVHIENIPVRKRKGIKTHIEEDEQQDNEEHKSEEGASEAPQEEEEPVMWNNNEPSGFLKLFYNYKGLRGKDLTLHLEDTQSALDTLQLVLDTPDRYTIQLIRRLEQELPSCEFTEQSLFKEALPVDINQLHNVTLIANDILSNPEAKEFHQKHIKGLICPFSVFWGNFTETLLGEGLEATPGLKLAVKRTIDRNSNGFITLFELNNFFTEWAQATIKNDLLRLGSELDNKQHRNREEKLFLLVENTEKDPDTGVTSFEQGQMFEISHQGLLGSPRFCGDKVVYIGKSNKQFPSDISFHSADTRVSPCHFSVNSRKDGFYLVDNAGVKLQVKDSGFALFPEALITISSVTLRVKSICSAVPKWDDNIICLEYRNAAPLTKGTPELVLEIVSEGTEIVLNSENWKSVIGSAGDCDVNVHSADCYHTLIELKPAGWCVFDLNSSTGTWLDVNTFDRKSSYEASLPLKLYRNCYFKVPGTLFRVVDSKVSLSSFPFVRKEVFKDLYILKKCVYPSSLYKEFDCVHKPTKAKYSVLIVLIEMLPTESIEFLRKAVEIKHQNVQRIIEIIEDQSRLYIVIEKFVLDVHDFINNQGSSSESEAATVFSQVIAGLNVLHSKGILHYNLTPNTIFIVKDKKDSPLVKVSGYIQNQIENPNRDTQFAAPESFRNKYSLKSDIWSSGVVLYSMISGSLPFTGTPIELKPQILSGTLTFNSEFWGHRSPNLKLLIRSLLSKDPSERPSCESLLSNNWLNSTVKFLDMTLKLPDSAISQLKAVNVVNKLKQAIRLFALKYSDSKKDENDILEFFTELDKSNDGKLNREEILEGSSKIYVELTENELESIIRTLDPDMSGTVEYREFLSALTAERTGSNLKRLEETFGLFDQDGSGTITAPELKLLLGETEGKWQELISKVDSNEDGKIDLKEFKTLLVDLVNS